MKIILKICRGGNFTTQNNDTVEYICGILCFYTTSSWGINFSKNVLVSFFSGSLIPIDFFPGRFGEVVKILPFASLSQNPVYIITQRVDIKTSLMYIMMSTIWLIVFSIIAKVLFKHAIKKITVQGG